METKILYFSKTGNIEKFVNKLKEIGYQNIEKIVPNMKINEKFVLIVPTIYFGEVPIEYKKFLKDNPIGLIGVAGSGNRNWGRNFAIAADKIAKKFNVPIIHKFELSGNKHDVKTFKNNLEKIENEH